MFSEQLHSNIYYDFSPLPGQGYSQLCPASPYSQTLTTALSTMVCTSAHEDMQPPSLEPTPSLPRGQHCPTWECLPRHIRAKRVSAARGGQKEAWGTVPKRGATCHWSRPCHWICKWSQSWTGSGAVLGLGLTISWSSARAPEPHRSLELVLSLWSSPMTAECMYLIWSENTPYVKKL